MKNLPLGIRVGASVPASAANLGPGFDSLGLALELRDEVRVETVAPGDATVTVTGEGADTVDLDQNHLIIRLIGEILATRGYAAPTLSLEAKNSIPHARGLGSSAAAVSAAVVLASVLLPEDERLSIPEIFAFATTIEGHPDNVAAALSGGLTVSWALAPKMSSFTIAPVAKTLRAVVCVPSFPQSTASARAVIPETVPHEDAVANSARTALMMLAVDSNPMLLMDATEDFLHQEYRSGILYDSLELMTQLRDLDLAAVISGAGPTVLVLTHEEGPGIVEQVSQVVDEVADDSWRVLDLGIAEQGAKLIEHKR
ncbi:homoserine kinase [Haematomicrobium sanguinis]|uniref:homoserine kinase n=1 Tax=Haematomicrobium sanguinis TaxID=479106 RepID=UPI00047BA0F9|nr:homoserine kinase [Haematomicrobium sanguinis]